ncbi:DNA gyrase inhibitor YacG [BD1-7 clade bacterium]|uniref:DNA gyrase inhibitor YacG n=1 Tax=BD1-7 clade bacterium TaxID=2029982 RepID=A0A5S9N562_9GAMM|nr:DNA gyrase inhibitor YacG [BD1-7 clade bacterium]
MKYQCPSCQTELTWQADNEHRPFCSARCKNKDFVAWTNEENVLPGSPEWEDMFSQDLENHSI